MTARVRLRKLAEEDIDGHFLFIAQDKLDPALRFLEAVRLALDRLGGLPELGSRRDLPNIALAGLRM